MTLGKGVIAIGNGHLMSISISMELMLYDGTNIEKSDRLHMQIGFSVGQNYQLVVKF
jgi:hypothetical protein